MTLFNSGDEMNSFSKIEWHVELRYIVYEIFMKLRGVCMKLIPFHVNHDPFGHMNFVSSVCIKLTFLHSILSESSRFCCYPYLCCGQYVWWSHINS